jgi:hypothetical protein
MGDTFVISGLTAKRAELLGLALSFEAQARQARADLVHVDAALRLFDPNIDLTGIRGKHPSQGRSQWFENGEMSRLCREPLRNAAEPLSAETMVRQIATARGMDMDDNRLRSRLITRFLQTLHRMAKGGDVERIGKGNGVLWTLPASAGRE